MFALIGDGSGQVVPRSSEWPKANPRPSARPLHPYVSKANIANPARREAARTNAKR